MLASRAKDTGDDTAAANLAAVAYMLGGGNAQGEEPWPETLPDFVGMKFLERDGTDDNGKGAWRGNALSIRRYAVIVWRN